MLLAPTLTLLNPRRVGVAYDADAAAFFTAAGITDSTQKAAVNHLVLDLKAASIWSSMLAIYPLVGGTATKHSYNLNSPAQYQITWSGTVTHNANGITGDGSTGYGDTGLAGDATTVDSLAFGAYSRTDSQENVPVIGVYDGSTTNGLVTVYPRQNTGTATFDNTFFARIDVAVANSKGLFTSSRTSATSHIGYQNGSAIVSTSNGQGALISNHFTILGVTGNLSARNLAFAFITNAGLSGGQVASLSTAVQAFETTLGRQV